MDQMSEQKIIQLLLEAHANELMLVHTLTAHIAMTPHGDYRDGLELHLRETREHAERIQAHLAKREHARGIVQLGYGLATGVVGQMIAMTKFPVDLVRGMNGEEKLLRNARDEAANEAIEIAMYLALEEVASVAGDTETATLARSIRRDEEKMLERLLAITPRLAQDAFEADVRGEMNYDLRNIGAMDAARTAASTAARRIARTASRSSRKIEASAATDGRGTKRMPATSRAKTTAKTGAATTGGAKSGSAKKRTTKSGTSRTAAKRRTTKAKAKA